MARPYPAEMPTIRPRRKPDPFRRVTVVRTEALTPHLRRITLSGPELAGLRDAGPAASVRLLPRDHALELPIWNGNEFLDADGSRPSIRSLTPRRIDADPASGRPPELDVDIVLHGHGPLATWADAAAPGAEAAVTGTGRGTTVEGVPGRWVLLGDESALPAIATLLEAIPAAASVDVLVEVTHPDARVELPAHPGARVAWCDLGADERPGDALVATATRDLLRAGDLTADVRVWAAGEAASVQRIRRHLFEDLGHPRSGAVVRGYWKVGRSSAGPDEPEG
jgi:NADPH-dependent ferric siderophore reductase